VILIIGPVLAALSAKKKKKCLKRKFRLRLVMSLERIDYMGHSKVALGLECHQEGEEDYWIACTHIHTHTILWSASEAEKDPAELKCPKSETFQLCLIQCVPLQCEICTY